MKKLLNTLYVSTQGVYLRQEGETVVAEKERQVILRLPVHTVQGIVCFGNVLCSPFLLGMCAERGINVSFLTEYGRFLANVTGGKSGNVLLRVSQMKTSFDKLATAKIARNIVVGKILNSRNVLQRRVRDHGDDEKCAFAIARLANSVRSVQNCEDIDEIRGMEGEAASYYFDAFNALIVAQQKDFTITCRNRRPPLDPTNALLSFLYVILSHDCTGALASVGLDPQVGFLHALRPGRASLALDLMEEFRAVLVDRVALSLINRCQLTKKDFKTTETGAVTMSDDARKTVLTTWQSKKKETIKHPFLNENVEIGLLPFIQAQLLARHLRGDLDAYPPFILK